VVDTEHPEIHVHVVDFVLSGTEIFLALESLSFFILVQSTTDAELSGPVKQVIDEALPILLGGKASVDEFNRDYLSRHRDSVPHLVTGKVHITVHCSNFVYSLQGLLYCTDFIQNAEMKQSR